MKIQVANQTFVLLPEGAVITAEEQPTLILSDVHLGKSATFRAHGLAVPEGDTERDLERICSLVTQHNCAHLIVAGDLFHSPIGLTETIRERVEAWVESLPCSVSLVRGNHDLGIGSLPSRLKQVRALDFRGIDIIHDPTDAGNKPSISGHLHPVIRIPDGRRTSLRLPCFHLSDGHLNLPAFGSFTGGQIIRPKHGDRIFVFPSKEIVEVPPQLLR